MSCFATLTHATLSANPPSLFHVSLYTEPSVAAAASSCGSERRTQPRAKSRNEANRAGTAVLPASLMGSPVPDGSCPRNQATTSTMLAVRVLSVRCLRFSTAGHAACIQQPAATSCTCQAWCSGAGLSHTAASAHRHYPTVT